jgi:hypothetical protein
MSNHDRVLSCWRSDVSPWSHPNVLPCTVHPAKELHNDMLDQSVNFQVLLHSQHARLITLTLLPTLGLVIPDPAEKTCSPDRHGSIWYLFGWMCGQMAGVVGIHAAGCHGCSQ